MRKIRIVVAAAIVAVFVLGFSGSASAARHWKTNRTIQVLDGIVRSLPQEKREAWRVRRNAAVADWAQVVPLHVREIGQIRCRGLSTPEVHAELRALAREGAITLCRLRTNQQTLIEGWATWKPETTYITKALVALASRDRATICHEMGHALGLMYHSYDDPDSCMGFGQSPSDADLATLAGLA